MAAQLQEWVELASRATETSAEMRVANQLLATARKNCFLMQQNKAIIDKQLQGIEPKLLKFN